MKNIHSFLKMVSKILSILAYMFLSIIVVFFTIYPITAEHMGIKNMPINGDVIIVSYVLFLLSEIIMTCIFWLKSGIKSTIEIIFLSIIQVTIIIKVISAFIVVIEQYI